MQSTWHFLAPGYEDFMLNARSRTWKVWATRSVVPEEVCLGENQNIGEFAPDVYRIFPSLLCQVIINTPWPGQLYALSSILLLWLYLLAFYRLARCWLAPAGSFLVVLAALAVIYGPYHVFSLRDLLAGLLLVVCLRAFVSGHTVATAVSYVLLMLTREDALLVPAIMGIMWLMDRSNRRMLVGSISGVALFTAYRGIAYLWIGYRPYYCEVWRITNNLESFALLLTTGNIYHPLTGFITTLSLLLIVALYGYKQLPSVLKGGILALMLHIVVTILIALLVEQHKWPLLLPLFVPAAIWTIFPQMRRKRCTDSPVSDC